MKLEMSHHQTIIASWSLAVCRWLSIAGYTYYINRALEYIDPKSLIGNAEKAEPLFQTANIFFWCWASLILAAVVITIFSSKNERSMVILFQIVVLPSLELLFIIFYGLL